MKHILFISFTTCLIVACSEKAETEIQPQEARKSVVRMLPAASESPVPTIRLNPKLKCGLIADLNDTKDTIGYHTYINDTLFGPVYLQYGTAFNEVKNSESPTDGFYIKGKKEGQFNYYNEYGHLRNLAFFEQDDTLWKSPYLFRWKAFPYRYLVTPFKDEVIAELKHPNGEVWYKGEFKNKKPKGQHSIHRQNGTMAAIIDYNDWTLARYNYDEEQTWKGIIETSWTTYVGR